MIKCLIVEDEQAGQQLLLRKLANLYPACNVLSIIDNKDEAVQFINNNEVDLVFLDVQIIGGTGLLVWNAKDELKKIPKRDKWKYILLKKILIPLVIRSTAFEITFNNL